MINPKSYRYLLVLCFLLFGLATYFLFKGAFSTAYFQDDWFSLLISRATSIGDILRFFAPRSDVVYYRPLGMQMPFFISQYLFGTNPLFIRLLTLIIHLGTGLLIYQLLHQFTKNIQMALIGVFIYLVSAIHFIIYYWAATFAFATAPLFFFTSLIFYLNKKTKLSFLFFFIGLLFNELLITLPIILVTWEIINGTFKRIIRTWSHFVLLLSYGMFRIFIAKAPSTGGYLFTTAPSEILRTCRDYILWALGWPEEIHNQFVSLWRLNPEFVHSFKDNVALWIGVTMVFVILTSVGLWRIAIKRENSELRLFIFGLMFFHITLLPVMFYAHHAFPYYLPIAFVGLLLMLFPGFKFFALYRWSWRNLIIFVLAGAAWYFVNWKTVEFNTYVHWVPRRALISQKITSEILHQTQHVSPDTVFVIVGGNPDENKWAMGDQNGLKYLYGNNVNTIYTTDINLLDFSQDKHTYLIHL